MEQNMQFLMWMKSKQLVMNSQSWEEQAFAEDAAGPLGAFVWPPRSYACTFCRREFRSAQALGGHMNVHRRDRARLKQSLCNEENHQDQDEGNHNINSPPFSSSSPSRDSNTASRASNNDVISSGRVSYNILREQQRLRCPPYSRNIHLHDDDGNEVETTLSVGITGSNSKRLKSSASFPFYQKNSCSSDHHQRFPFQYSSTTDDVVDLELRLGDSPAVK